MKSLLFSFFLFLSAFLPSLAISAEETPSSWQRTIESISSDGAFLTLDDGSVFQIAGREHAEKVLQSWKVGDPIFGKKEVDESYFALTAKPDEEFQVFYWGPPTVAEKTFIITKANSDGFTLNDGSQWHTFNTLIGLEKMKPGHLAIPVKTQKQGVVFFIVEGTTLIEIERASFAN